MDQNVVLREEGHGETEELTAWDRRHDRSLFSEELCR